MIADWRVLAETPEQLPPVVRVIALMILVLLLVVLLLLIAFNRMMARWARRTGKRDSDGNRRGTPSSSLPDEDDWTRRPLIEPEEDDN